MQIPQIMKMTCITWIVVVTTSAIADDKPVIKLWPAGLPPCPGSRAREWEVPWARVHLHSTRGAKRSGDLVRCALELDPVRDSNGQGPSETKPNSKLPEPRLPRPDPREL